MRFGEMKKQEAAYKKLELRPEGEYVKGYYE